MKPPLDRKNWPSSTPMKRSRRFRFAGRVVAEGRGGLLMPLAVGGVKPLVAEKGLATELAVAAAKIFVETVKAVQISAVLGRLPTGNQHPLFLFRLKPIAGINGVRGIRRFGRDQEPLLFAGFPMADKVAVAAGAFVAKIARRKRPRPWPPASRDPAGRLCPGPRFRCRCPKR